MEVWHYNYMSSYDELYHHGIKGMRWGVRRFQNEDGTLTAQGRQRYKDYRSDQSTRRSLTRHVAADKKNLKDRGEAMNKVTKNYNDAQEQMRKASSKVFISRKKRQELVDEANANLTKAGEELEKRRADLNRAERIYNKDAEALFKHVDDMTKKFGRWYSGNYTSKQEYQDRLDTIKRRANDRY